MPSRISERAGDRESPKSEQKERRRHHRSSRTKHGTPRKEKAEEDEPAAQTPSLSNADSTPQRKASMPVPELQRRSTSISPNGSRTSLPYPSFSKAHSREAVNSKDNLTTPPRKSIFTPDPTDIQQRDSPKNGTARNAPTMNGPPSPPLTVDDHAASVAEKRRNSEAQSRDMPKSPSDANLNKGPAWTRSSGSNSPAPVNASPLRPMKTRVNASGSSLRQSRSATPTKRQPKPVTVDDGSTVLSAKRHSRSTSPASSSKTSVAPQQPKLQTPFSPDADDEASPSRDTAASPRTPTARDTPFWSARRPSAQAPSIVNGAVTTDSESPMPPPPPPPPAVAAQAPRVDYLMLHGGLPQSVPKHFLAVSEPGPPPEFSVGDLPDPTTTAAQVQSFFSPFSKILDDYTKVMTKNGSIAVATGYRSIARRLLDRLEAVFARDISSETCVCAMCQASADDLESQADTGVNWGEVLEYVSGRQELPQWPPFVFNQQDIGLGISSEEYKAPMQKLDIDVPEEYREHYIRQSKKTKQSIDRWLSRQTADVEEPPEEADDDTLTFAILTHLEDHERPLFSQILGVAASRPPSIHPDSRTQTPLNAPRSPLLAHTGQALQRLYRLPNLPRSPECALFLVKNKALHNVLATLAAISDGEWDILTSGRFDGFLRSGAEDLFTPQPTPSRGPLSEPPSRSASGSVPPPTPSVATSGAPVALDEETEIAALAEVEREIFLGMESLEDAFEALHVRAETVRCALRERGAGLAMAAQARRGTSAAAVEARLGTPASAVGVGGNGWNDDADDSFDDGISELAPDDSASNVSRSRYRRPKRRTERRTPAPVEEEDEDAAHIATKSTLGPGRISWSRNSLRKR